MHDSASANETAAEPCLDLIFRDARTHIAWSNSPVPDSLLKEVYDLAKWGPTSANCSPVHIVFVRSEEAKVRLLPAMAANNVEKTRLAPVTAIMAYDLEFYENLPRLFPHVDAKAWFVGNQPLIQETAFRNGTLQAAYFIIAARARGLDCGPMSGFDQAKVNAEFFPDGRYRSNFVVNLGYGDASKLYPRNPRLEFDEVTEIL